MTAPTETRPDDQVDETPDEDVTTEAFSRQREEAPEAGPLTKDDGTPFTKADLDALQEALRKARKDARAAKRGQPDDAAGDGSAPDAVSAARAEETGKWKPLVIRTAARSLFTEAGIQAEGDAMNRVIRMLDLDDLDVDEHGQVDGLREQVEDIRTDFPQLFTTARSRAPRVDVGDKTTAPGKRPSASELLVAAGRARGPL